MIERDAVLAHRAEVLASQASFFTEPDPVLTSALERLPDAYGTFRARAHTFEHIDDPAQLPTTAKIPTPMLEIVENAYHELRYDARREAAIALLNEHLDEEEPRPKPDETTGALFNLNPVLAGRCSLAEDNFYAALQQLRGLEPTHRKVTVYHDNSGTAIAVEKEREANTALLLQPVTVVGHTVVAGTIVFVGDQNGGRGQPSAEMRQPSNWILDAREVTPDSWSVIPLRASPWVYEDPLDRGLFATRRHSWALSHEPTAFDEQRAQIVSPTLDDFRQAAAESLGMLGISQ